MKLQPVDINENGEFRQVLCKTKDKTEYKAYNLCEGEKQEITKTNELGYCITNDKYGEKLTSRKECPSVWMTAKPYNLIELCKSFTSSTLISGIIFTLSYFSKNATLVYDLANAKQNGLSIENLQDLLNLIDEKLIITSAFDTIKENIEPHLNPWGFKLNDRFYNYLKNTNDRKILKDKGFDEITKINAKIIEIEKKRKNKVVQENCLLDIASNQDKTLILYYLLLIDRNI